MSSTIAALLLLAAYATVCRLLRFQRLRQEHRRLPYKTPASFAAMTTQHAWEIQKYLMDREFPFTWLKSWQFALFRTYGIPSISKLLVQTKQLSTCGNAPRRYVDTEVLIQEFTAYSPASERANTAIARMNYLHNMYRKSGKITNSDLLYTLSLFVLEPVRWINRYEWRELTPMELCAIGTFWKSVGDAMDISYHVLPSHGAGWRDGLQWYQEVLVWSQAYETECMTPDGANRKTADETTAILLYDVPEFLKDVGQKVVSALMDDRLRKAMMYPKPPASYQKAVNVALRVRASMLRYFALPRPYILRVQKSTEHPDKQNRYYWLDWEPEPWYVKDSFVNRWRPLAWFKWLTGRPYPGSGEYKGQGYLIHEIGPIKYEREGMAQFEAGKKQLMAQGRGGCPFAF